MSATEPWIGILALQGGVSAHEQALRAAGVESRRVLKAEDLVGAAGLILPGGESTAQARLLASAGKFEAAIMAFAATNAPILATCAGLILAARWGLLDVDVERNGWGRQIDSFESIADDGATELVCIRAPRIRNVRAPTRVVLTMAGEPVRIQRGRVVGTIDHPELTSDHRLHRTLFAPDRPGPDKVGHYAGDRRPRLHV